MKRNMEKIISSTENSIDVEYDIDYSEVKALMKRSCVYSSICDAFVFGYAQGMQAAKEEMRKLVNA